MALCKNCGLVKAGLLSDYCGKCIAAGTTPFLRTPDESSQAEAIPTPETDSVDERGSAGLCIALGLAGLAVGIYFLLNPTVPVPGAMGIGVEQVANLHRMTIGQTLSIVGAVFLAAGIRPRRT